MIRLADLFIASSHNTCITGSQWLSSASKKQYCKFLDYFRGGCVEIDLTMSRDVPMVAHGVFMKMMSGITLEDALKAIVSRYRELKDTGFNPGPLIITFDNKDARKKVHHDLIWGVLNDVLYVEENRDIVRWYNEPVTGDTPFDELRMIMTRWSQCYDDDYNNGKCVNSGIGRPPGIVTDSWININKSTKKGNMTRSSSVTIVTKHSGDIVFNSASDISMLREKTSNSLIRIYPNPVRHTSSANFNPIDLFRSGVQFIALNMQDRKTIFAVIMRAFFNKYSLPEHQFYAVKKPIRYLLYKICRLELKTMLKCDIIMHNINKAYRKMNYKTDARKRILTDVYSVLPIIMLEVKAGKNTYIGPLYLLDYDLYDDPPYCVSKEMDVTCNNVNDHSEYIVLDAKFLMKKHLDD